MVGVLLALSSLAAAQGIPIAEVGEYCSRFNHTGILTVIMV